MNILAREQVKLFQMDKDDPRYPEERSRFLEHYYGVREKNECSLLGRLSLEQRKRIHRLMYSIIKLKNHLEGIHVDVLRDRRTLIDRPVIFAVTHVGKSDVEAVSEAIRSHYYLLSGDYERMQGTVNELFLKLNGVVYVYEHDKRDRRAAVEKMISVLRQGGNMMYFPEGTWNLSPELPVLPCYWGIVEVAQRSGAAVVPVAAEQYEKRFVVNIGQIFNMEIYGEDKAAAIETLRDAMATLKWEIWETEPIQRRKTLTGKEWENYIAQRLSEWPLTLEDCAAAVFRPKGITAPEEAFGHLRRLVPSIKNGFLFHTR